MKYVDEFHNHAVAAALAERIEKTVRRPWAIMEVCGGQTHSIVRFGLDGLLMVRVFGPRLRYSLRRVSL